MNASESDWFSIIVDRLERLEMIIHSLLTINVPSSLVLDGRGIFSLLP